MSCMSAGLMAWNSAYKVLVLGVALCAFSTAHAALLAPPG
jgi:hypothetical protein